MLIDPQLLQGQGSTTRRRDAINPSSTDPRKSQVLNFRVLGFEGLGLSPYTLNTLKPRPCESLALLDSSSMSCRISPFILSNSSLTFVMSSLNLRRVGTMSITAIIAHTITIISVIIYCYRFGYYYYHLWGGLGPWGYDCSQSKQIGCCEGG